PHWLFSDMWLRARAYDRPAVRSVLERRIQQVIHHRWPLVPGDETFPEVASEIVVGGLRPADADATDGIREAELHVQPGKGRENSPHLLRWELVVTEPAPIQADTGRAEGDLRFLVRRD